MLDLVHNLEKQRQVGASSQIRSELFQRLSLVRVTIQQSAILLPSIKVSYLFNSIFTDDLLHLMTITLPLNSIDFFECSQVNLKGELTGDRLGYFFERFLPLFIEEIKYFIKIYHHELGLQTAD